jgi:hypothetical protein
MLATGAFPRGIPGQIDPSRLCAQTLSSSRALHYQVLEHAQILPKPLQAVWCAHESLARSTLGPQHLPSTSPQPSASAQAGATAPHRVIPSLVPPARRSISKALATISGDQPIVVAQYVLFLTLQPKHITDARRPVLRSAQQLQLSI